MFIFIKTMTGKTIGLDLEPSCSVDHLMARICDKEGIPPEHQKLIYDGKQLEEGFLISDYGVHNEVTIHLGVIMDGG